MASTATTLVVGSKELSSWSLRPWLLMRQAGLPFTEVVIQLDKPDTTALIAKWTPSGKVPVLIDRGLTVWDSLAIAEYLNERHPEANLWPADPAARAHARAISAEMHSMFRELRVKMPMAFSTLGLKPEMTEDCRRDVVRMVAIWCDARKRFGAGGKFLFGAFTIADAMFAPVASRFTSYGTHLADFGDDGSAEAYRAMLMALPAMAEWGVGAKAEVA
jgi:glutathione S-transferase